MNVKVLEPEEWQMLEGHDLSALFSYVEPENMQIVAVMDEGKIAAHVAVLRVTHFEGLEIAPEYRGNPGVFRALIRAAFAIPRERGERWAMGAAAEGDERMDGLCLRLGGARLPITTFAIGVD